MGVVLLGNTEDRRVKLFQRALEKANQTAELITWSDLLENDQVTLGPLDLSTVVRIESPSDNQVVHHSLIKRGAKRLELPEPDGEIEHGQIFSGRLWFAGFNDVLTQLARRYPNVTWMNHPTEIASMVDKAGCHSILHHAKLRVPPSLGVVTSYDQLRQEMQTHRMARVFIKPCFGSSASGVVALQVSDERCKAQTSAEMVIDSSGNVKLFNSLKFRSYENVKQIKTLIDTLGSFSPLLVERWLAKAGYDQKTVDMRIVVIDSQPRHMVLRSSRHPITNLHLGNERGDINQFWKSLPETTKDGITRTCRKAAQLFPRTLYFGADIMVTTNLQDHAVLELNAFGDLLPNLLHQNQTTHQAQVAALRL